MFDEANNFKQNCRSVQHSAKKKRNFSELNLRQVILSLLLYNCKYEGKKKNCELVQPVQLKRTSLICD